MEIHLSDNRQEPAHTARERDRERVRVSTFRIQLPFCLWRILSCFRRTFIHRGVHTWEFSLCNFWLDYRIDKRFHEVGILLSCAMKSLYEKFFVIMATELFSFCLYSAFILPFFCFFSAIFLFSFCFYSSFTLLSFCYNSAFLLLSTYLNSAIILISFCFSSVINLI